jgi:hypothetical protein
VALLTRNRGSSRTIHERSSNQPRENGLDVLIGIAVALLLTWLLLIAALAIRRPKGKMRQLEAAYRRFSPSVARPGRHRRRLSLLVVGMLGNLNVVWLGLLLSRAPGERVVESTSTHSASPGGLSSGAPRSPASGTRSRSVGRETIQVEDVPDSARPFESVRIQGTYRGGADTFLRVQRWE